MPHLSETASADTIHTEPDSRIKATKFKKNTAFQLRFFDKFDKFDKYGQNKARYRVIYTSPVLFLVLLK